VSPLAFVVRTDEAERLRREVDRLPAGYRDPVVLHYFHGLTTPETARLLDLPEATVRTRLRRARGLLRSRFPAGLAYGLLFLPWVVKDAVQGAGLGAGAAAIGGAMGTGGVAAVAVAAAVVGAVAGAALLAPSKPAGVPEAEVQTRIRESENRLREEMAKSVAARDEDRRKAQAERDDALGRAEKAEQDAAEARRALEEAEARAAAAPAPGSGADVAAAVKEAGPRFAFPEFGEAIAKVDWKSVGRNTRAMVPLISSLRDAAGSKEPPDLAEIGKIQKHNAALIEEAAKIMGKVPGIGANGAFTHPAFQVNSMAATLDAAGLPLTDAQAKALGQVGTEFTEKEKARAAGYTDATWELQKVIDEADLKDRFFEAAFAVLTPEQRNALVPAGTKGLVGFDLYSSGLMLAQLLAPVQTKGRDDYAAKTAQSLGNRTGLGEEQKAEVQRVVAEWAATLPEEWFTKEFERTIGQPLIPVALVAESARRDLALLQRIVREMPVPEEKAKALRRTSFILFPMLDRDGGPGGE
jgi:hypothetical protein